jgi:hypothetical protein
LCEMRLRRVRRTIVPFRAQIAKPKHSLDSFASAGLTVE